MPPPASLIDAAGLVADGAELDWGSMSSHLSTDDERALADVLASVARIAQEHRKLHDLLPADRMVRDTRAPGSIWGHLELIDEIGRGSYGSVYRAWDGRLDRVVALKLFHGNRHPELVMQEGRMLARVDHDNVVTVYGADIINGVAGLWMEYLHGKNLDQVVRDQGALSAREATLVGLDIARALAAIHGAGLLHCDVKAQNVVREPGGRMVLMDLGAGRAADEPADESQSVGLTGTPRYMAPELFAQTPATVQSDVYSAGVLLFYLVSGKYPVDGKTLTEIREAHAAGRRAHLRDVRPDLPSAFLREVSRALDPDPARRHRSAGELETALTQVIAPAEAPPAPETRPPIPWAKPRAWIVTAIFAVVIAGLALVPSMFRTPAPDSPVTVAVLPIRNLTGDPAKAFVADGLTEVLISNLARVRALSVPSTQAVSGYRDGNVTTAKVAEDLGADVVLAGSIIEIGDLVRIGVNLVDPAADRVIWTREIIKPRTELLAAQGEIARLVAAHLMVTLTPREEGALRQQPLHPEAQDAFLRGLAASESVLDRQGAMEAAAHLKLATDLEPDFADAWAQRALAELRLIELEARVNRAERAGAAKAMAQRAIELNPASAAGYLALGNVQLYHDWDFAGAERTFRDGLDRAPSSAVTMQALAGLLVALGRFAEAIPLAEQACDLERLVPSRRALLGVFHYYARNYSQAETEMRRALSISPAFPPAHFGLGWVFAAQGRYDEAISEIERAIDPVRRPSYVIELARVHTAAGHRQQAAALLSELADRQSRGEGFSLDNHAYVAAAAGRVDEAFAILDQAVAQRLPNVLWAAVDPRLDPLRTDPRFPPLLFKIGLRR
jgi:TolB-like protein